jgi:hypothetical protein
MAVEDDTSHVANIGKMVEDMELKMRNLLQEVYFGKAKDVVGDLRSMCMVDFGEGRSANVMCRYSVAQPDEQGQGDAEGDDQQYGPVRLVVVCNEHTRITNEQHQHGALALRWLASRSDLQMNGLLTHRAFNTCVPCNRT